MRDSIVFYININKYIIYALRCFMWYYIFIQRGNLG